MVCSMGHQDELFPQTQQISMSLLDKLFCEEEHFEQDLDIDGFVCEEKSENFDRFLDQKALVLLEQDLFWENDELLTLFAKEKEAQAHLGNRDLISNEAHLDVARKGALDWMIRVSAHYGFVAMTTVLAVNYFDKFLLSPCFQRDKPWMSQLAAVACLSLAAKVEETQVPLLLDLQMEESKFVFESKTIMRMELLVLSTLQWKMNPVTPLSFIDYILRRLGLTTHHLHWEFLRRCECLLLSLITNSRFGCYLPSVMAAATMCFVIQEIDPCNALEYQNQLMGTLEVSKENVDDCYKLILEVSDDYGNKQCKAHKRKYQSRPGSPNGVIDSYFSSDSSNDSWALAPSSLSSSPEPLFKKSRAQDQQMRLAPLNRVSIGVLSSPR